MVVKSRSFSSQLAEKLAERYISNLNDILELSIDLGDGIHSTQDQLDPQENVIVYIDFAGAVHGLIAFAMHESDAFELLELGSIPDDVTDLKNKRVEVQDPLKEILNTAAGPILTEIRQRYPLTTMLSPKVIYGSLSFPKVPCSRYAVKTGMGECATYVLFNHSRLDMYREYVGLQSLKLKNEKALQLFKQTNERMHNGQFSVNRDLLMLEKKLVSLLDKDVKTTDIEEAISMVKSSKSDLADSYLSLHFGLRHINNQLLDRLVHEKVNLTENMQTIYLYGPMNEYADFSFLDEIEVDNVELNLRNVTGFDKRGVRKWYEMKSKYQKKLAFQLSECSPAFIHEASHFPEFTSEMTILSVIVMYDCLQCGQSDEVNIDVEKERNNEPEDREVLCDCGGDMQLEEYDDSFVEFVNSL